MKEGWEYKKIDDISTIVGRIGFRGYTKNDLVSKPELGAITLSPSNIINGELSFEKCSYISLKKYEESPEIMLAEGDVVLVKTASIGKCSIVRSLPHKATLNPQFVVFKNIKIDNEYFNYYIKSPYFQKSLKTIVGGVAIPTLSQKKLGQLEIYFPTSYDEQRRIVSYLDSSFKLIDEIKNKALKSLTEAKALFQSALAEAMEPKEGWEEKTFGEICTYHKEQKRENGYKYIGMENIESGTGNLIGYGATDNVLSSTFYFKKGEVLYGRLRPYLKKVYIAEFDGCCSTEIFPIKTNGVLPGLIKYWFLTDEITNKINDTSAGCRMPRGNMNEVLQFHLYIPSDKQSQKQIVSRLDKLSSKVRAIEEKYQKMVEECDALKQAMLRDVFE